MQELAASTPGLHNTIGAATGAATAKHPEPGEPTKALALTFTERRDSEEVRDVLLEPVPAVEVVDCPNRTV